MVLYTFLPKIKEQDVNNRVSIQTVWMRYDAENVVQHMWCRGFGYHQRKSKVAVIRNYILCFYASSPLGWLLPHCPFFQVSEMGVFHLRGFFFLFWFSETVSWGFKVCTTAAWLCMYFLYLMHVRCPGKDCCQSYWSEFLAVCFETGSDFVSLIDPELAQTTLASNNEICMLLPSKCWHRSLNFLLGFWDRVWFLCV